MQRVAAHYEAGYIRLVPTDGGTVAMWVVDPASGTVMAVDETGRGGGRGLYGTRTTSGTPKPFDDYVGVGSCGMHLFELETILFVAFTLCSAADQQLNPAVAFFCLGLGVKSVYTTASGVIDAIQERQFDESFGWSVAGGVEDTFDVISLTKRFNSGVKAPFKGQAFNITAAIVVDCILQLGELCSPFTALHEGLKPYYPSPKYERKTPQGPGNRPVH